MDTIDRTWCHYYLVKESALLCEARYIHALPSAAVLSVTDFVRLYDVNKECIFFSEV